MVSFSELCFLSFLFSVPQTETFRWQGSSYFSLLCTPPVPAFHFTDGKVPPSLKNCV